jgi:Flp pilus assembly protein TadG
VTRAPAGSSGQATVELAMVLPLVAVLVLTVVQVAAVTRAQVLVTHAAREGARAAAVDPAPTAAAAAAERSAQLEGSRLTVTSQRGEPGGLVTVAVAYRVLTDVPVAGALFPDVVVRASASMRVE